MTYREGNTHLSPELRDCKWLRYERMKHAFAAVTLGSGLVDAAQHVFTHEFEPMTTGMVLVGALATVCVHIAQGPSPER